MNIFVLERESSSVVNPPMIPLLADIVPSNCAPLANKVPLLSTLKLGPNLTKKFCVLPWSAGVKSM